MTCPTCEAATRDGLPCQPCTNALRANLREIPTLMAEVGVTFTRQAATGERGGPRKADETPMPFDWDSSDVRWVAVNTIGTWISDLEDGDFVVEHQVINLRKTGRMWRTVTVEVPATMKAWCDWLLDRIDRIRTSYAVTEIIDEIDCLARTMRSVVDVPGEKVLCGVCIVCERHLYASPLAEEVVCRYCAMAGTEVRINVAGSRAGMFAKAKDVLVPKRVILEVAPEYGCVINPNTLKSWIHRGELVALDDRRGTPLYRLGDAIRLATRVSLDHPKRRAAAEVA